MPVLCQGRGWQKATVWQKARLARERSERMRSSSTTAVSNRSITDFDISRYNGGMNVSLTPELERLVDEKVKSGLYQTASEVVREALRLLNTRDEQLERLRTSVQAGFEQIYRGKATEYRASDSRKLVADIKTRGRRRLSQQPKTGTR